MKPLHKLLFLFAIFLSPFWTGTEGEAFAQRGKHGTPPAITTTVTVNEYTALSIDAAAGATTISVANSNLNTNGRFPGNLAPGDLIMIIQMQGASINGAPSNGVWPNPPAAIGVPTDSTWGSVINYNNCGNWELAEVFSVPNGTSITIDCPLTYSYTATGKTQVVRMPRYSSLTVNAAGAITCDAWNGIIGGICAIEVENNTTLNGIINTTGKGFRGGQASGTAQLMNLFFAASTLNQDGAEKGEGIAGYRTDYTQYGGMYERGAPANGGGGGNIHNGGGGGGANGGNPASWNGHGMPDISVAGYVNAWNLQYAGFAAQTSSGGGQGGYAWSANNNDPTTVGPGNAAWGGQSRHAIGGYGGRPLDYTTGKLFLGGGGGAGDQNDGCGGNGSSGGGLIYFMNYGIISGTGQFVSNGNAGGNSRYNNISNQYKDGAGGGGAGGTIILNSVGAITGISLTANGGKGGDQLFTISDVQAEGPGGGGSGGYIAISNGSPTRTTNGGANGTTNSTGVNPEFPPNGATMGGVGTNTAIVTNFVINAPNTTICAGQAATLTATLSGFPPGGTSIIWYDASVGGNVLPSTGGVLTTSVISTAGTYTYYVGSCPGTYHQPVLLTVTNSPSVTVSPNTTICSGSSASLTAGGGTSYSWSPSTGLSNPNVSNPVATPAATTTYVVTASTACGPGTATVVVAVTSSITATISGNNTICAGGSTTLSASGGGNYSWSTGASTATITVSPTTTTTYSVNVGSGSCTATTSITVNVSSGITASISPGNTTICPGSPTTITASGGSSYIWSTAETTAAISVSPTASTTYSVITSSGSCSDTASMTLTVSNNLSATINGPTNICSGGNATLTAAGGVNYLWSTNQTTSAISVAPTSSTTYSVLVSAGTCTASASITVNVGANITANITGPTTLCGGTSATLTASGGSSYSWNTGSSSASISINPAPSTTTTYTVIASSGSCADTATLSVNVLPQIFTYVTGNNIICMGDSATLTASMSTPTGNSYLWSTGETTTSISVAPSTNTTYTVTGSSGACSDTVTVTVTVLPQASITMSANTTICAGQSTQLTATGGTVYLWSNGSVNSAITVAPLVSSTYTVIAGIGACSDTDSVSVSVLPSPTVTVSANSTICGGDAVTLNASGGTNYSWSNGATSTSTTVSPATTTSYTVITSDGTCNDTGVVTITVSPPPAAAISGNPNICQGSSATLTAAPAGATYAWSSGETTAIINPTASGTYSVIVSVGSCKDTAVITTTIAANPTAVALSDTTIFPGQSTNLSASGGTGYVWDNSMSGANITVSPSVTTVYCVTVSDANGCKDTACVTVTVEPCSGIYLPNAFSPNTDGENDELQLYTGNLACVEDFLIVLHNRFGEEVYRSTDPYFKWDGSYKGWFFGKQTGGTEVYGYYMNIKLIDGTSISKKGNISLLR